MDAERDHAAAALMALRTAMRWRADTAQEQFRQRVRVLIRLGHLPLGATLATYEAIVTAVAADRAAEVFLGTSGEVAVLSNAAGSPRIVVCDRAGVVETAFPSTVPAAFLCFPRFTRLGVAHSIVG
jgi:hypothetical protein